MPLSSEAVAPSSAKSGSPWLLPLYLLVVLATGALLAPVLYELGQWYVGMVKSFRLQQTFGLGWLAEKIEGSDFPRFFNRAFLVAALAWLFPFAKWSGSGRQDLALERNSLKWKDSVVGFLLAAGLLLAMGWALVAWGRFSMNHKASVTGIVGAGLFAAVCVALMEEFFFRGILLGFLLKTLPPRRAMLFLAAFFAILHLLQPPESVAVAHPNWSSGLWMVGQILGKFGNASFLLAEFCTLFVVGWILGQARWHTRSLWLPIGLHAGWVFGIKVFAGLTRTPKSVKAETFLPWIGKDLKSGLAPLVVLVITGLLVWLYFKKFRTTVKPS